MRFLQLVCLNILLFKKNKKIIFDKFLLKYTQNNCMSLFQIHIQRKAPFLSWKRKVNELLQLLSIVHWGPFGVVVLCLVFFPCKVNEYMDRQFLYQKNLRGRVKKSKWEILEREVPQAFGEKSLWVWFTVNSGKISILIKNNFKK